MDGRGFALGGNPLAYLSLGIPVTVGFQGVHPQRDAPVVRPIAEGVVRDHDERSLTGDRDAKPT